MKRYEIIQYLRAKYPDLLTLSQKSVEIKHPLLRESGEDQIFGLFVEGVRVYPKIDYDFSTRKCYTSVYLYPIDNVPKDDMKSVFRYSEITPEYLDKIIENVQTQLERASLVFKERDMKLKLSKIREDFK